MRAKLNAVFGLSLGLFAMFAACPASHADSGNLSTASSLFVGRRGISNPFTCGPNAFSAYTRFLGSIAINAQTSVGSPSTAGCHVTLRPGTRFVQLNWNHQGDYTGNFEPRVQWNFADGSSFVGNAFSTNISKTTLPDGYRLVSLYSNSYGTNQQTKFNTTDVTSIDIEYTNATAARNGYITQVFVNGLLAPNVTPTLVCPE